MTEARNSAPQETPAAKEQVVEKGQRQLLIAPRRGPVATSMGLRPMSSGAMKGMLSTLPGVDVMRVLKPKKNVQAMSLSADEATDIYVVRVDNDRAELLKQAAPPNVIVEEDAYLDYGGVVSPMRVSPQAVKPNALKGIAAEAFRFRVVNEAGKPVSNVKVTLAGDAFPSEGETDKKGELVLEVVTLPGGRPRTLFVKPSHDYWDRYVTNPSLTVGEVNVIRLLSLKSSVAGFPDKLKHGWGQKMMGLDQMPSHVTGKGIKIAIIDSGADNSHPLLQHIKDGADFTNRGDAVTWGTDTVGHGSHCAGVIAARSVPGLALSGFAPEAEIHVFKIFPGGQFSSLLEALDECMARDIDIVNMSLGSAQPSQAVEQKLEEAVLDGIACIVAAGNSGEAVQYPASSPNVLAVSAIGKLKEFPSEAWDTQTVIKGLVTREGVFSPSFTCFGPQVGVCAPGVAVISTIPNGAFEAQSGTSMAAPHVTGLAALLLAHHPLFQTTLQARGPQRVAMLFNMIKSVCTPYPFGADRAGSGVPTLEGLVHTLQPAPAQAGGVTPQSATPSTRPPDASAPAVAPGAGSPSVPSDVTAAQPRGQDALLALQAVANHLSAQGLNPAQVGAVLAGVLAQPALAATFGHALGLLAPQQALQGWMPPVPSSAPNAFTTQPGAVPLHPLFWGR